MKKYLFILIIAPALIYSSCRSEQRQADKVDLSVTEFADKINELQSAPIVDVRTQEEFSSGHLINALNFDWNGDTFESQITTLDKTKPVLVYCRSGARSASAAKKMRAEGFQEVYQLEGGIIEWVAANKPVTAQ